METANAPSGGAKTWKWLKIDGTNQRGKNKAADNALDSKRVAASDACLEDGRRAGGDSHGMPPAREVQQNEECAIAIPAGQDIIINALPHSKVHAVRIQTESTSLGKLDITVGESAEVSFSEVILPRQGAAGTIYSDFTVRLAGSGASFKSDVAYMAVPCCSVDIDHTVSHNGKSTRSVMRIAGALSDGGEKIYRGTIDFHKGCKGSKGEESEEVLMLSPSAKNRSLPVILCDEEDVEGEHGATIGRLDAATLFYISSRGMDEADAIAMLCRAKLERVARLFPNPDEKDAALAEITKWFEQNAQYNGSHANKEK